MERNSTSTDTYIFTPEEVLSMVSQHLPTDVLLTAAAAAPAHYRNSFKWDVRGLSLTIVRTRPGG